jgi:hypothetical protein
MILLDDKEKMIKAKEILQKIANGINPINGQSINDESFLSDPRIIRCFFYVSEVLSKVIEGQVHKTGNKPSKFIITDEEKKLVVFPEHRIGVNEIAKCINRVIDLNRSKKLTGVELNKQLKKMGLLSEHKNEHGKTRTVINEKSKDYGMEIEKRNYNGNEYEMVVFNDTGKRFILDNIDMIMNYEV